MTIAASSTGAGTFGAQSAGIGVDPASYPAGAIAIIGMAGRFPGADSVTDFWRTLSADQEGIVSLD